MSVPFLKDMYTVLVVSPSNCCMTTVHTHTHTHTLQCPRISWAFSLQQLLFHLMSMTHPNYYSNNSLSSSSNNGSSRLILCPRPRPAGDCTNLWNSWMCLRFCMAN